MPDSNELMRRWFQHVAWADQQTLAALRRSGGEPAQAAEIFAHVLGAEHTWLQRMQEQTPSEPVWPTIDLDACATLAEENARGYEEFLRALGPGDLDRGVTYRNSAGREFTSRLADMLSQVALHGSYHRGQVAVLMRGAGFQPEPSDYIAFVRGAPAATRQDSGR